jgi:hypothetical protein
MTKRWNPTSSRYEEFSAGERRYPVLTASQRSQLDAIQPSILPSLGSLSISYFPCRVKLRDATWSDHVFIAESSEYIRVWGVWPDQDKAKRGVKIEDVLEIQESPSRLPRHFAQMLYDAGESGMGYLLFALRYNDLTMTYHVAGGAVDFVTLPEGKAVKDIKTVLPHEGRNQKNLLPTPEYAWCLYTKE